jgi:hypothetical protein
MEQGRAVNKVLRDMKLFGFIDERDEGDVRILLNALWVAGNESGNKEGHDIIARKQSKHLDKPVIQFDKSGNRIAEYSSVTEAANEIKCTRDGLYKAIKKRTPTKKGYIWMYET